ncbi:hypothetical protein V5799_030423, partial [Amblyomma americanum]
EEEDDEPCHVDDNEARSLPLRFRFHAGSQFVDSSGQHAVCKTPRASKGCIYVYVLLILSIISSCVNESRVYHGRPGVWLTA